MPGVWYLRDMPNREAGEAMSKLIITLVGSALAFGVSAYRGRRRARIVPMADSGIGRILDEISWVWPMGETTMTDQN